MEMSEENQKNESSQKLVYSVVILHMFNHIIGGSMPMLYPDLMEEFNISYAELGIIRSAAGFASGFPQMFVGLFRRWFSGRVLVSVGNFICALMNIGISVGNGFLQFMGFSVIAGVGSSVQHPIGASIVSNASTPQNRGRMLGLNQSVPSIAFAFTPLLSAYLLTKMGWRSTLGIMSLPALFLSLYILFFVKGSSDIEGKTRDALNFGKLREQLKNRNVFSISLLRSVMAFRMGVRTFLPLYFIDILGFSSERSSWLYSIMLGGGILGPFFWGWVSDKMNRKVLIIAIMACSATGYFMLNFVKSYWGLAALLFFIGFMVQTVIVQSIMTDSVERSQLDQIFGLYFTIGFTIASFSSAIFGWVVETYGFGAGFTYITVVSVVSLFPAFFIQEPRNIPQ